MPPTFPQSAPTDSQDPVLTSEEAKAVAKRERQRLKEQARLKREHLEQMRAQQNVTAESGEVRTTVDVDPMLGHSEDCPSCTKQEPSHENVRLL